MKRTISVNQSYSPASFLYFFLGIWLLINLVQAYFTQLSHDESYYWMYSRQLAWGYFDHPPAIAVLIKAGYSLFQNELGVRFFVVLLSTASIYLTYLLLNKKKEDVTLFAIICFCMSMFNAAGFLTVPDIPLVFFTALFFLIYKKYLDSQGLKMELLLAITIALLLYSKYHGILVVFFVILSNPKLLLKLSFWRIAAFSIILFLPHIIWQVSHDYPSIKYHLVQRSKAPYKPFHTIDYILGQLLVTGPLISIPVIYAAIRYKAGNLFERALKFTLAGFFIFFFISSFKGWVEANWTIPAFIPLIILAHQYISDKENIRKWIFWLAIPSVIFILAARLLMVFNFIPDVYGAKTEFHKWDLWARQIKAVAGDRPVVFQSTYQMASKYTFYAQKDAFSSNTFTYRKNMFDIWDIEENLQGKEVLLVFHSPIENFKKIETAPGDVVYVKAVPNYRSFNKVKIKAIKESLEVKKGNTLKMDISFLNTYPYPIDLKANPELPVYINANLFKEGRHIVTLDQNKPSFSVLKAGEEAIQQISLKVPTEPGDYELLLGLSYGPMSAALNSKVIKLKVSR